MSDISVTLGNAAVVEILRDEDGQEQRVTRSDLGNQTTTLTIPGDWSPSEALLAVSNLWAACSDDPPEWVESSDEAIASMVARQFTTDDHECAAGRPSSWQEG